MADAAHGLVVPPGTVLESPRLVLRPVERGDLPALLDVNGDPLVTRFLPYPTWRDAADADAWFDRMEGLRGTGAAAVFVIAHRGLGQAIGTCLLFHHDAPSGRAELGYVLGRAHWRRGYMGEALRPFVAFAFGTLGLRRLEAVVDPRNGASAQVLARLGFAREGVRRQHALLKGELVDSALYGLLRDEWVPA